MEYKNECTKCGLVEIEHRALKDYNKPSPCSVCSGETRNVMQATIISPAEGGAHGRGYK